MIIAKHPGINKVLAKMASEAGLQGTGKMSRSVLIVDQDSIFIVGRLKGRVIVAEGNLHTVGVTSIPLDGERIATQVAGRTSGRSYGFGDVLDLAGQMKPKETIASADALAGRLFRARIKQESRS